MGRDLAWQFVKDKFVILKERYESGFLLSRLVKSTTIDLLGEVEQYFINNPQSVQTIRLNSAWLERDGQGIENFFKNN